ncbi:MAG: TetR/AcrR family transcriptional regulator [Bacillota bacterium]|nr:TetR/AcrR family transcriptional regulator [Bacillota bacterium]
MKSNKTRERIIETSLKLFNEKKASNVSTVQISAEMQISPGNLYYYFANKEEIIRCIWKERMLDEIKSLADNFECVKSPNEFCEHIKKCFEHYDRFVFFYCEASTLFLNDPVLKEYYDERLDMTLEQIKAFQDNWIRDGLMVEMTEAKKQAVAENVFLIMKSFLINPSVRKNRRYENVLVLIEPYLTEAAGNEMAEILDI